MVDKTIINTQTQNTLSGGRIPPLDNSGMFRDVNRD